MKDYQIVFRHMRIVMPDDTAYDCWLDGRTNIVFFRQEAPTAYELPGKIAIMSADEEALASRFEGATVTILAQLSDKADCIPQMAPIAVTTYTEPDVEKITGAVLKVLSQGIRLNGHLTSRRNI